MQGNTRSECTRCGRALQRFDGQIGYCTLHKWVSPAGLGFEAEAAEKNRQDAEAENARLLDAQRREEEEKARMRQERHRRAVRRAVFVGIAFLAVAAVIVLFVIRPGLTYRQAESCFAAGEFEQAGELFASLGAYRDAPARALLCAAMNALHDGRVEEAAEKLEQLTSGGRSDASERLADAIRPLVADWKARGLTPQALLFLLDKIDLIDPNGVLDAPALKAEGHTALLEEPVRDVCTEDVDRDGEAERGVLNDDYSVTGYRMTADGNLCVPVGDEETAACEMLFGKKLEETDPSGAVVCCLKAYRARPDEESFAGLSEGLRLAVADWEEKEVSPALVPALLYLADSLGVELSGVDREAVFEKAALASAGETVQSDFVDWNRDGYRELLTLDAQGVLSLYAVGETWEVVSSVDTGLPGCSYAICDPAAPVLLVVSEKEDEFLTLTGTAERLTVLFRESGISAYRRDGSELSFSRRLAGSIERRGAYRYTAEGADSRPVRTGIDWQQNGYPMPTDARSAVLRYWEARTYEIAEEAALLVGEDPEGDIFSLGTLSSLPAPDDLDSITVSPYMSGDQRVLLEVSYHAGGRTIRTWMAADYASEWRVAGAADTFGAGQDPGKMDVSLPILSLNEETVHTISQSGGRVTYRLLIPAAGRLALNWQSGTEAMEDSTYAVTMLRGSLTGENVFTYELQPSPNRQRTKDLFASPGVYYMTVEARTADAEEYRLMIALSEESCVELENNDSAANATPVELDTAYSASLSRAADVDVFSFTLAEDSAVNVTLRSSGTGGRATVYTCAVYSAADASRLSGFSVPGSAQLSETGNLYLSAGSYYVQVAKGSGSTNDEYVLTVHTSRSGTMESEPNDTQDTASAVPVNEDIHGSFAREGDIDFYTFLLDRDAVIQPRFTFTPTDSASRTYVLTVLDGGRHELLKLNIGGKESSKLIAPLALPVGSYTIRIENPRFVRQDYTLHLVCMPVNAAECEPNDSAGLATELSVGQARTGVLSSDADVDYYKLSFAQTATITLRFSFAQSTIKNTAFTLSIEQNGRTQWSAPVKGDAGSLEQTLQFPAGEYYLKVKPSTWIGAVYTIQMN